MHISAKPTPRRDLPTRKVRRALEDYQFDRTDVEAGQPVELTVTNGPFGLTIEFILGTE